MRPTKPVERFYLACWVRGWVGGPVRPTAPAEPHTPPETIVSTRSRWLADVRRWLPQVLRQRCRNDENWSFRWPRRWWVTFKAATALLCNRRGDCHDHVEVALGPVTHTYSYEYGEGGEFNYLAVPYRGWRYCIGWDGWP